MCVGWSVQLLRVQDVRWMKCAVAATATHILPHISFLWSVLCIFFPNHRDCATCPADRQEDTQLGIGRLMWTRNQWLFFLALRSVPLLARSFESLRRMRSQLPSPCLRTPFRSAATSSSDHLLRGPVGLGITSYALTRATRAGLFSNPSSPQPILYAYYR